MKPSREAPSSSWPLLQGGYAKSTTKKYHTAVRDFYGWCKTTTYNHCDVEQLQECLADTSTSCTKRERARASKKRATHCTALRCICRASRANCSSPAVL